MKEVYQVYDEELGRWIWKYGEVENGEVENNKEDFAKSRAK